MNIGESVWKAYEYSDLSKILNIHLFLTVRRVSNSEDAKICLFNCHSWNIFSVFEIEVCESKGSSAKLLLGSVICLLLQSCIEARPKRILLWGVALSGWFKGSYV